MNVEQRPPRCGDVWTVEDENVILHAGGRVQKGPRPVLILTAASLDMAALGVANVVPLSTSGRPDLYTFPLERCYEELAPDFKPDPNSHAIINWYQPIEIRFFRKFRGRLSEQCQIAIKLLIQQSVLGIADYDVDL